MDPCKLFDGVLYGVSPRLRRVLEAVPDAVKSKTEEIRLRAGLPVCLTVGGVPVYIYPDGSPTSVLCAGLLTAERSDLDESFLLLCRHSVYAHAGELKNGFIRMRSGHRAGVCGTFTENGSLSEVTSVNIRIAREVKGCANELVRSYDGGGFLIAGPPGSGKTTVLRDLIRQLSSGMAGDYRRVAVIDSRGEISGGGTGEGYNDLGGNTDVLMIPDKAVGVEIAVRTLFPDIVAFDEIGTAAELEEVAEGFHAGVSVITTAHSGSVSDLLRRSVTSGLLRSGAVSKVALMPSEIGSAPEIFDAEELLCKADG